MPNNNCAQKYRQWHHLGLLVNSGVYRDDNFNAFWSYIVFYLELFNEELWDVITCYFDYCFMYSS